MKITSNWLSVCFAGTASIACNKVLNMDIIAPLSVTAPLWRDVVFIIAAIVPYLAILWMVQNSLFPKAETLATKASVIATCTGAFCVGWYMFHPITGILCVGFTLWELGGLWINVLFMLALCQLPNARSAALCICIASLFGDLGQGLLVACNQEFRIVVGTILMLISLTLSRPYACQNLLLLDRVKNIEAVEFSNPFAFISPFNPAFCCLFVFNLVFGIALSLNCVSGIPVDTSLVGAIVALCAFVCIAWSKKLENYVDLLATAAAFLVLAGLLCATVSLFIPLGTTSNYIIHAGDICFSIIRCLVVFGIGMRNRLGALRVIAWSSIFTGCGTLVGTYSGHVVNSLVGLNDTLACGFLCFMLLSFLALSFVWLSKYSFRAGIFGVEPLNHTLPIELPTDTTSNSKTLDECCSELGAEYGLTKREIEICILLAKGRNGRAISEQCYLSYNTVKTHVKHIYMKLDVHSQQELIDLVEDMITTSSAPETEHANKTQPTSITSCEHKAHEA